MSSVDECYHLVKDIMDREGFLDKIEEGRERYGDLLDQELLARLIVAGEGRNEDPAKKIGELRTGESATVTGMVVDLGVLRTFKRGAAKGRVRNLRVDDGTGSVKLVLWDDDADRVGDDIVEGCTVTVVNGYVQDRGYGLQISPGKWGMVNLEMDGEKD